ncbi:MAG: AAC(3) family N-acetyltransferase [Bacteroidota bacterium]
MTNQVKRLFVQHLKELGLLPGDTLLVHAAFSSLKTDGISPQEVLEWFLEYLGEEGTFCMPALSYKYVNKQNPCFDQRLTNSCVGILPETFRLMPGVRRSLHPTHSVCAIGKYAASLSENHHLDSTPCGKHSPFSLLPGLGGKILMLGCGLNPNTSMHAIEEHIKPPYVFGEPFLNKLIDEGNRLTDKVYTPHGFDGWEQMYERVGELDNNGWIKKGPVLAAESFLIDAEGLWREVKAKLAEDELFFVDRI